MISKVPLLGVKRTDVFINSELEYGDHYDRVWEVCQLKEGDLFIDIGSNLGQEIKYFANRGIKMDSYEPHPYFYKKLINNYGNLDNVKLNNVAIWTKNEKRNFYFKNDPSLWHERYSAGGATLVKEKEGIVGDKLCKEVDCIDIVDVINKHDNIKVLKIDVEGAEYMLLERLIEADLIEKPEFLFVEDHSRKFKPYTPELVEDIALGYIEQYALTLEEWAYIETSIIEIIKERKIVLDEWNLQKAYITSFLRGNNITVYQW